MTKDNQLNLFKLLLIGDAGTGKSNILSRLTKNEFKSTYNPTNGVNCERHNFVVDILDIGGQKKNHFLVNSLVKDVDGILLVYDISNATTFGNVTYWLDIVTRFGNPETVVKLVGNKNDLDRAISIKSVEQFVADKGISFIETSALDPNSNVEMIFQCIIEQICTGTENSGGLSFSTCGYISNCMLKNHKVEHQLQNQQQSFQVVLIDLKLAANGEILCVEKSLDDSDLKYVALSYRWGELHETVIDTKLGYTAVITSFHMYDFYSLCYMILRETDLKEMDYVWVDAICVDQTNHDKRKATIHQMSTIYEKAKYILAVPDLHITHLRNTSKSNTDIIDNSYKYSYYLYDLIHGNTDKLSLMDKEYLDECDAPNDSSLRQLLNICTDHFIDGFMKYRQHYPDYNEEIILDHICRNIRIEETKYSILERTKMHLRGVKNGFEGLHHCHQVDCPLQYCHVGLPLPVDSMQSTDMQKWKQLIRERSTAIRHSMDFMVDLIKDWATRVWVISEYNIAKKKNNLKFWFIQLGRGLKDVSFFTFDFMDSTIYTKIRNDLKVETEEDYYEVDYLRYNNPVYLTFHHAMSSQLTQQTFLEMMLKSKASKNEDRFYAIFPLTDYKQSILDKTEVDKWNVDTLTSVKLKMFQVLNTKDRLNLLFLSGHNYASFVGQILPTFATSSIDWNAPTDYFSFKDMSLCNFDLDSSDTIIYHPSDLPCLNLKPKQYYIVEKYHTLGPCINPYIWSSLPFKDSYKSNDIVCIYNRTIRLEEGVDNDIIRQKYPDIYLQGSFKNNIWIIMPHNSVNFSGKYIIHTIQDYNTGFNIY